VDYIVNYKKWSALFEQDELSKQTAKPTETKNKSASSLDQNRANDLKSTGGVSSKLDYVNTDKLGDGPGKEIFIQYKDEMWVIVYGQIIGHSGFDSLSDPTGNRETGNNYVTYWVQDTKRNTYPFYGHFKNLKIPQEWNDQSKKLFNERYWTAFNEKVKQPEWVKYIVGQFNNLFGSSQDKPSEDVKSIQGYIKSKLETDPKLKGYVKNNGTPGRDFVDGVWGPVSSTAWLMFAKNLVDPSYTIGSATYQLCKTRSKNIKTPEVPIDSIIEPKSTVKPANATAKPANATAQKTVTPAVKK
jgi:hypothetical protein